MGITLFCFGSTNVFGADNITVYYFPFEFTSFVAITQESIKSEAAEKWTISSDGAEASTLIKLLNSGRTLNLPEEEGFNTRNVRVLVLSGDEHYFIDMKGVVLRGNVSTKIDSGQFDQFRDSLSKSQRILLKESPAEYIKKIKQKEPVLSP